MPPIQRIEHEEIIIHGDYNKGCEHCNDIALIRLKEEPKILYGKIKMNKNKFHRLR